jgi:hypothetical protein
MLSVVLPGRQTNRKIKHFSTASQQVSNLEREGLRFVPVQNSSKYYTNCDISSGLLVVIYFETIIKKLNESNLIKVKAIF